MGHVLTPEGLSLDTGRVEDIMQVKPPQNRKELQVFLGMINFVACFVPNMSTLSAALRDLLKKHNAWVWTDRQDESFHQLRTALTQAPVLAYFNQEKPSTLSVDASQHGVGAVLLQQGQPIAYSSRSLTEAQQRYAQIKKETLAIVHGCTKFQDYIFGQREVIVESDHRPLESIFRKPLCECPVRLQRMRLVLQRFPIKVTYKPGKELFLADALSRFPSNTKLSDETEEFQINVISLLPVSNQQLESIRNETNKDAVMAELRTYSSTEWPETKNEVSHALRPYWHYRDELHVEEGLLLRGDKIVIPPAKRAEVLRLLHAAHGGEEKMKMRAREVMFWPGMNADISVLAKSCAACEKYKHRNSRLPMLSHEIPNLPWQVVGLDIFYHDGQSYLILVDFYSFFFEIQKLRQLTAASVKNACMTVYATHGIPAKLCTDNGPPFNSACFRSFNAQLGTTHVTSSPYYPRSNGMAERAVQEAKKLLTKCPFGTFEFYSALMEWRNMPRDEQLKSPAQRLMGRQTRTQLPVLSSHLEPRTVSPQSVRNRLSEIREKQRIFYNRTAKHLPQLHSGSPVSVYDTIRRHWSPAVVVGPAGQPRSYTLTTDSGQQL